MKIEVLSDPIYDGRVFYLFTDDRKAAIEALTQFGKFGHDLVIASIKDKHCFGTCYDAGNGNVIIWAMTDGALVHEIVHAASAILGDKGIPLVESTEECYAYYISWIYEAIMTKKKNSQKIKSVDPKTPKNNQGTKPNSKGGYTTGSNDNG